MSVLLIAPSCQKQPNAVFFPIGLAYIASYLQHNGIATTCLNLNRHPYEDHPALIRRALKKNDVRAVGLGGLSHYIFEIKRVTDIVRAISPDLPVIMGGGALSSDPETALNYVQPDVGVVGEGEVTMLHVAEALLGGGSAGDMSGIEGIAFRDGDAVVTTPMRKPIRDLDGLPYPDLEGFGIDWFMKCRLEEGSGSYLTGKAGREVAVCASRSCPFKCTFCFHPLGDMYRERSNESLVEELEVYKERYSIDGAAIYSELFAKSKDKIMDFCERLLASDLDIRWSCQLRVDEVDEEVLPMMREAGCSMLSLGFESGSQAILDNMRKKISVEQIEYAVNAIRDARMGIQANFLFGDPAETPETAAETQAFKRRLDLDFINWGHVVPYPGTALFKDCRAKGIIDDPLEFTLRLPMDPHVNMTAMKDEEYESLFATLWDSNEESMRRRPAIIDERHEISPVSSEVVVRCGFCGSKERHVLKHPIEADENGEGAIHPVGLRGHILLCNECMRKSYLMPHELPHFSGVRRGFQERLDHCREKGEKVLVTPAIQKIDLFVGMGIDFGGAVDSVLDNDPAKEGTFLGATVVLRQGEHFPESEPYTVFVLPSPYFREIVAELEGLGVPQENICCWDQLFLDMLQSKQASR